MNVALIAAVAEHGIIGKDGDMPFHLYLDRMFFRCRTLDSAVVMGRKTYQSLPTYHLDRRLNIVLSRTKDFYCDVKCAVIEAEPKEIIRIAEKDNREMLFVMGGADVYKQYMPFANEMWITEVYAKYDGDTKFPEYDKKDWVQHHNSPLVEENGIELRFTGYKRR